MRLKDAAPETALPDARQLKGEAVKRVALRLRPPVFETVGTTRVQVDGGTGYLPPVSVAEWADDGISRQPLNLVGECLILILTAAARQGADGAAAAVALAQRLTVWNQHFLFGAISQLPADLPEAALVVREIRGEWKRLGLQATAPTTPLAIEVNRPTFPSAAGGTRFSPSVPDFMKAEWQR